MMSQKINTSIVDCSNKDATIGFVIYYPFQFYVYKNVYKKLEKQSEFIIDLSFSFTPEQQQKHLDAIVVVLQKHEVPYRVLYHEDYQYPTYLESFFLKYVCLASVWEWGCFENQATKNCKKIRFPYGVGKELTMLRPSGGIYDLSLANGPRDSKHFSVFSKTEIVGNTRFDDWFNGEFNQEEISAIKKRLDQHKKTIVYLPTHSDLSSVEYLADSLKRCSATYNVIVKIHYAMVAETERLQMLADERLIILDDNVDIMSLFFLCDVVISDNSSAIFEAILVDKPVVVADFWDKEYLDDAHKDVRKYAGGTQAGITYSDSIEQVIKREKLVHLIQNGDDLERVVSDALCDDPFYKEQRKKLNEELYSFNDGNCSARAAEAILKCIADDSYPKPPMFHAFEVYARKNNIMTYNHEQMLRQKIDSYEKATNNDTRTNTIFSVTVIVCDYSTSEKENPLLEGSLKSILWQDYQLDLVTVHILTKNARHVSKVIKKILEKNKTIPAFVVHDRENESIKLSASIQDVIDTTKSTILCFMEGIALYPSNWITSLVATYKRNPHIGGVGGYLVFKEINQFANMYLCRELAKRLGIENQKNYNECFFEVTNNLELNPAGSLSCVSYKRELFPILPTSIDNELLLEKYIKKSFFERGVLTFIPYTALSLYNRGFKDCVQARYWDGFFEVLLHGEVRKFRNSGGSFFSSIFDSLNVVLQERSFLDAFAVLVFHMSFWYGSKKSKLAIVITRILSHAEDAKKTKNL